MKVIGITGGIGVGKSKASRYIAEHGYAVIDADQIGRDMTADGQPMLKKLNELFGPEGEYGRQDVVIVEEGRKLNRGALAQLVFSDEGRKKVFDKLMHKEIIAAIDETIAGIKRGRAGYEQENVKGILIDAPLLFETGIQNKCDAVVVITADEQIRIQRVMKRDGMCEEQIRARMAKQMPEEEKIRRADHVVDNSGDYESLKSNLDALLEQL